MKTAVDAYVQSVALFELFIRDENKENVRWVAPTVSDSPTPPLPRFACRLHKTSWPRDSEVPRRH
jgi:hypothetical protein